MTSLKTTSLKTKSLINKSLTVSCGLLIASLALTGNALAADTHVNKTANAHPVTHVVHRAPARQPEAISSLGFGVAVLLKGPSWEFGNDRSNPNYGTQCVRALLVGPLLVTCPARGVRNLTF